MQKESGIEITKQQLGSMDEFSQWLHDNKWSKNNSNSLWFHYKNMYQDYKFSEVYQWFLEEKTRREGGEEMG